MVLPLGRSVALLAMTGIVMLAGCKEVSVSAEPVASIEVTPAELNLLVDQTADVVATVKDAAGRELRRNVTWSTASASIATVNGGRVTAQGPGTTQITASVEGKSDAVTVHVGVRPVETVEINPPSTTLTVGDSVLFTATAKDAQGSVLPGKTAIWRTSDATIALVRANGMVVGQNVGNVIISATIDGIAAQSNVNVRASVLQVSRVQVDPPNGIIGIGDSLRFRAIATSSGGNVIAGRRTLWTSANTAVAQVDTSGKATGSSLGTTTISANIDGVTGQATLEVSTFAVASVEVTPAQSTITLGNTTLLQAVLRSQNGNVITGPSITWSSSNPGVASVNGQGLVTSNAIGTVTITATASGRSGTATVNVVAQPAASIDIQPNAPLVHVGDTVLLTADLRDSSNRPLTGRPVSWVSADTQIAVVEETGPNTQQARLIGRRVGSARITATAEGKSDSTTALVDTRAELVVAKIAPFAVVKTGDTIAFNLRVRNLGPHAADSVVVTDTLPSNAPFVNATGGVTPVGNVLRWPAIVSLGAGDSASYTVRIIAPATGVINIAAATTPTYERNRSNNRAIAAVSVSPADLVVGKSANVSTVNAGDTITYTIQVGNTGASVAANVVVTDTLPRNVRLVHAGGGTVSGVGPDTIITWPVPSIDVNTTVTFTVRVLAPAASGTLTNVAAAVSGSGDSNPSNNRASVSVTVNALADLAVTKTASPATVGPGGLISYTIRVRNLGPNLASNVTVTDILPPNVVVADDGGGDTSVAGVVTWRNVQIAALDSARFTLTVSALAAGSITNQASAMSTVTDPVLANNTSAVTTLVAQADVEVTKSGPANINAGDTITYTISVTNHGPDSASAVVVRDSLPAGVTFIDATGGGSGGAVVVWSGFSLSNGESRSFTLRAFAPDSASTITNVARVTAATSDADPSDNRATASTTVIALADLAISKSGTASVSPGDTITYTLSVVNSGPSGAANVILVDSLPGKFVDASHGGTENNGVVTWALGTLPVSPHTPITVRVLAPSTPGAITNVARVTSTTQDPDPNNNRGTFSTTLAVADLVLAKSGPASALVTQAVSYTIDVANTGPSTAQGVVVTDTMPAGAAYVSSNPAATVSGNVLSWNLGNLTTGATQITVTLTMPSTVGPATNAAAVRSATADLNLSNNHDTAVTTLLPAANLGVTKTVSAATASAGDTVTFTISVTNAGPSTAVGVVVTDSLPLQGTFVNATGGVLPAGRQLTFAIDSLVSGGSQQFAIRWALGVTGTITNTVFVSSSTADPVATNNAASAITATLPADVGVALTAPSTVTGSTNFDYTITLTNNGPGRAMGISVTSPVPQGTTFVSASGGGTEAGGLITFPTIAALGSGQNAAFIVTLTAPLSGAVNMSAVATSATTDTIAANNTANASATASAPPADVEVVLMGAPDTVNVSDTITYTLTVKNNGPSTAAGITLTHTLAQNNNVVLLASASGFPVVTGNGRVLTWNLPLLAAAGQQVFIVKVTALASRTVTSVATASLLNPDPVPANNQSAVNTVIR